MNKPEGPPAGGTDYHRRVYAVLGLPFDAVTMDQAEAKLLADLALRRRNFFSTPNLNFLVAALDDVPFRDSVLRSDLSIADGMPIIWIARLLGIPLRERVAGSTLFERLRAQRQVPVTVFFFGGPDGVARRAGDVLNAEHGTMRCVGARSPGFGSIEQMSTPELIAEINDANADLLVVALGAKRGQSWIEHNLAALRPPLVSHLGAVVNFVAGTVSRAPGLVGRLGLEWLWRIKEEPALWRRYWRDGVALLGLVTGSVLPGALAAARQRRAGGARTAPVLHAAQGPRLTRLTLAGDWLEPDLAPLRAALAAAGAAPGDLELDLAAVTRVDSALIGLLMLAFGHHAKAGTAFSVTACSAAAARALRLARAEYLLQGAVRAPASAPVPNTLQKELS
ncbi:WecB/TagA/CpsF family glycosyltransferase [Oxalobacteraceae bacterium OTU3CINTB1]|nr:WecB/TagA/CpsF family glycosyltransferase [Oxalobacteraceae bacterium OTU3CINTB1]